MSQNEVPIDPIAADWLALRRQADTVARQVTIESLDRLLNHLGGLSSVLDVGAGTGANAAWLSAVLSEAGFRPDLALLDHDTALLERIDLPEGLTSTRHAGDLGAAAAILATLPAPRLVSASALLDVLPRATIESFVETTISHAEGALIALTVTGEATFTPAQAYDEVVLATFNDHQSRADMAGPAATHLAAEAFRRHGWHVELVPTTWLLNHENAAMTRRWLIDRVEVVRPVVPDAASLEKWVSQRMSQLDTGELEVEVGHLDLLAWPAKDPQGQGL